MILPGTDTLARLPNYVRAFGPVAGTQLFQQVELRTREDEGLRQRRLHVPGFAAPVNLRDTVADHAIFWQCLVKQQYDFTVFPQFENIEQQYRRVLEAGRRPLIIDCGANIGLATVWLARRFPDATVVAVEPEGGNFAMLEANTAHLGERIHRLHGAVWYESGALSITNPDAGSAAFRVEVASPGREGVVRAYHIDEICSLVDENEPLYVKLDIEGAQSSLFAENTDWVGRAWLISLELDDWLFPWQGTSHSFFRSVSEYRFDYLMRDESIFCFRYPD